MKNKREPRKRRKPTEVLTLVKAHAPQFSPSRVDPILTQHEEHLIKEEGGVSKCFNGNW